MQRHAEYTRERIKRLGEWLKEKIYAQKRSVDEILVSPQTDRISYEEAMKLPCRPAKLGDQFGPRWASYWFKIKAALPTDWSGGRVDLLWDSRSEATLWIAGRSIQGLNHAKRVDGRPDAMLTPKAQPGQILEFVVEMACNEIFGGENKYYDHLSGFVLDQVDLALFDPQAWEMYYDLVVLQELEAESATEKPDLDGTWAGELLFELNRFANTLDLHDRSTWPEAQHILKNLYTRRNATRVHELSAVGHAHLDTAWLWPLAETYRKCVRTFSTQTRYMDEYPEYKFACSQAVQYEWVKERNPDLYARILAKVKTGQWVPVGGTWVEPDCNIPSGESLCRQFMYGQRFFEKEFGRRCREFWNPDVFGYNGQLPQIMRQAGIRRFLTQKLSWNSFNKPRHHTFTWQGIDGSEVLAHFPPADTYNGVGSITELRNHARNYKDHDHSRHAYYLFGYGDGGGGPTKKMLEVLRRVGDLEGMPRSKIRNSEEFFTLLEQDCTERALMVGELYFELHRGTYTTQALVKRNMRKAEIALHDLEFVAAWAGWGTNPYAYPAVELERLWKVALLNQFHDILPGSSIKLVYEDSVKQFEELFVTVDQLMQEALRVLASNHQDSKGTMAQSDYSPLNTLDVSRREVASMPSGKLTFVQAPAGGFGQILPVDDAVQVRQEPGCIFMENKHLRVVLNPAGEMIGLVHRASGRETLSAPANRLELFEDYPNNYDAWDVDPFHLETGKPCPPAESFRMTRQDPLRGEVTFERRFGGKSRMSQVVRLDADARRVEFHSDVEWYENKRFLKVAFPLNLRAMNATYEMQFGCVERPTHYNTPYDLARFEVPGHRWADLSECGFGTALFTDCKYGYATFGNVMRISLLRAPCSPDPVADRGQHKFAYAVYPHLDGWQQGGVVEEAARFNVPLLWASGQLRPGSWVWCQDANLRLDTVKKAEDSAAIVLRLYECHGARGTARVKMAKPIKSAVLCNILEDDLEAAVLQDGEIEIPYGPFQVVSVKVTF